MKIKLQIKLTMVLGILALLSGVLTLMALTDIAHGWEPNLSQEWSIVQISAVIFAAFIGASLLTMNRVIRSIPE